MGGSLARNVATGLGAAYTVRELLAKTIKLNLKGAKVVLPDLETHQHLQANILKKWVLK